MTDPIDLREAETACQVEHQQKNRARNERNATRAKLREAERALERHKRMEPKRAITKLREAEAVIEKVRALLDTASDERGVTWWTWIEDGLGGALHDELRAILKPTNQEGSTER